MRKPIIYILILSLALNLAGLFFGLPYADVFGDELPHVIATFKIMDNKSPIVPWGASYLPPLFDYLLVPIYGLIGLTTLLFNFFGDLADFQEFVILWREWFLAPARLIAALFGTGTVYVLYLFARKLFNEKIALLASFLLAINFLHVHESQIGHIWSPISFFTILTAYGCYLLYLTGERKWYWLSALAIGLGYAIGQISIIFYPLFLLAHTLYVRKSREKFWNKKFVQSTSAFLILIIVFSALNFYAVYKHFYDALLALFKVFGLSTNFLFSLDWIYPERVANFSLGSSWFFIAKDFFFVAPIIFLAGLAGIVLFWRKNGLGNARNIFLIFSPLAILLIFSFIFYNFTYRYILPAVPFLVILAAYFIFWLADLPFFSKKRNFILAVLIVIISAYSLLATIPYSLKLRKSYTVSQAVEWAYQNVPSDSRLVADVYLNSSKESINFLKKYNMYDWVDTRKRLLLTLPEEKYPQPNYFLIDTNLTDVASLPPEEKWADYALVFFYNKKTQDEKYKMLNSLAGSKELAAAFYPTETKKELKNLLNWQPQLMVPSILKLNYIGPYVEIYKIK